MIFFLVISVSLSVLLVILSRRVDFFEKNRTFAFNLALILMLSGFFGSRLLHVFYEEWAYYSKDPKLILYFWNGGFVYFGGFLLAWPLAWIYCRFKKQSFLQWADFFTPLLSLAHALGRFGCILAGCCYGQYCDLPWAIQGRHPTVWYLLIGELGIFAIILFIEKYGLKRKNLAYKSLTAGFLFFLWIFLHSLVRFFVEFYRDDFRGENFSIPLIGGGSLSLSISQVICVFLIALSGTALLRLNTPKN